MEAPVSPYSHSIISNRSWLKWALFLVFTTLVAVGAFLTGKFSVKQEVKQLTPNKPAATTNLQPNNKVIQNANWEKPISNQKGYPIITESSQKNAKELSIYSLSSQKITPTNAIITWGGGSSGVGSSDPLASPDLLYTSYIDDVTRNLWLISHETLERKQITKTGGVSHISGWTPDSKKVIFYIPPDSITTMTQGYGGLTENLVKFNPDLDSGFFLFDIDSGGTKKLYPVEYFEAVVDNDRILVRTTDQYYNKRLILFNFNTFEANYGYVKEEFGYGANQFNFTADGSKWTYTLSRNPTTDANIIYAQFPNKEGEQIDTGSWAETQFPLISPKGSKVAFSRRDSYAEPGLPNYAVWIYDTSSKQKTKHNVEGWAKLWVDENRLIVIASNASKHENYLSVLDVNTGNVTKIY